MASRQGADSIITALSSGEVYTITRPAAEKEKVIGYAPLRENGIFIAAFRDVLEAAGDTVVCKKGTTGENNFKWLF